MTKMTDKRRFDRPNFDREPQMATPQSGLATPWGGFLRQG
jgi:hypothetical protein